ncbi:MAG: 2,3-diphosphoglycerate synthetase [Actinobacteria bacterium]|nr:2,3-diphosphoglycerate synthetase [Actinomycetota bacterium]
MSDRTIVLIDGEHYPSVTLRGIEELRRRGIDPEIALLVGGKEKLGQIQLELGVEIIDASHDPERTLASVIDRSSCRHVYDLSDEPVLGYVQRSRLASVALWKGALYEGPGFRFDPPTRDKVAVPSVALIGTGKRSGKTAIGGHTARLWREADLHPVVVAMGRGGPEEPEPLEPDSLKDSRSLVRLADAGRHAASDYIEDAVTAGVRTVGAYRVGGGLTGQPVLTNVAQAVSVAEAWAPGLLLLEGSGSAIPPIEADKTILVVDATIDPGLLTGYFGLYRILLADLIVLTMCEASLQREHLVQVQRCLSGHHDDLKVLQTILRPFPLDDVSGKSIWFFTTASKEATHDIRQHLEDEHGAKVAGMSHSLADRSALKAELDSIGAVDAFAVELKAAAVDVVARQAEARGIPTIFVDNRPIQVGTSDTTIDKELLRIGQEAIASHRP